MSQLYELSDDPQRKEFLDDLFAFMQKRGEYTFAYSFARIYSHITSLDYYVDRLPVTPGCPSSDGCFHRYKPSTLEQAANDSWRWKYAQQKCDFEELCHVHGALIHHESLL